MEQQAINPKKPVQKSGRPPNVEITDDDIAIFWHVYRRRLIEAESIYALLPHRPQDRLRRRLTVLQKARYLWVLDIPGTVLRRREGRGADSRVFALDYQAGKLLNDRFNVKVAVEKWRTKNEALAWKNIPHTLGITDFMVSLDLATRQYPATSLIEFDELLKGAPRTTQKRAQPERFRTEVVWNGKKNPEGIAPDAIFALRNRESTQGDRTMYYLYEEDKDNQTLVPGAQVRNSDRFFRQSSILRKFVVYTYAFRNRTHEKWFGFPKAFRVLYVTGSPVRMGNMQAAFREHMMSSPIGAKAGMNLFADRVTLAQHGDDILAMPWQDELGREFYIDDRKSNRDHNGG